MANKGDKYEPADWGIIAEERFNDEINLKKIKSKEEYQSKMKDFLLGNSWGRKIVNNNRRSWNSIVNEMYNGSEARDVVEENQQADENDAWSRALRFEMGRETLSRIRDERKTAKDTRPVNIRNFKIWKNRPGRLDLRGIDTRRRNRLTPRMIRDNRSAILKRVLITNADRRLKHYKVFINPRTRYKQYRETTSGQWVPSPFKRKK